MVTAPGNDLLTALRGSMEENLLLETSDDLAALATIWSLSPFANLQCDPDTSVETGTCTVLTCRALSSVHSVHPGYNCNAFCNPSILFIHFSAKH